MPNNNFEKLIPFLIKKPFVARPISWQPCTTGTGWKICFNEERSGKNSVSDFWNFFSFSGIVKEPFEVQFLVCFFDLSEIFRLIIVFSRLVKKIRMVSVQKHSSVAAAQNKSLGLKIYLKGRARIAGVFMWILWKF